MSHANGKPPGRPPHLSHSKHDAPTEYDGQDGTWPRDRLLEMNDRFVDRLERAIAAGDESPQGTAGLASAR